MISDFRMRFLFSFYSVLCASVLLSSVAHATDIFEQEPILYGETEAENAVSRLQSAMDAESVALEYDDRFGYLTSLLEALSIPHESQVLVFSKTSLQQRYITPETPRAIYFNDDVYVGSVIHGDVLEVSVADGTLGAVFYTLDQRKKEKPQFVRQMHNCLQCHASSITRGIPGHVIRSVYTDAEGFPILRAGTDITTQDRPFGDRWGGWYVTGSHGDIRHMGNAIAVDTDDEVALDTESSVNLMTLDDRFDTSRYLTNTSDIIALLVLQHQTEMHNLFTRATFETRMALHRQSITDEFMDREPGELSESTQRIIANVGDKLVDYMLYINEVEYDDPIAGSSSFAEQFAALGPFDKEGRSLRDLDLKYRLFEYPLSYLIYSEQFDALPEEMKSYVYRRLWDILTDAVDTSDYLHLTKAKCRAIREILVATKPNLPDYWYNKFNRPAAQKAN